MNTTIPESEYQDCVEELNAKLADERKLNSDKNARIAELEEQIGRATGLIIAAGVWLEDKYREAQRLNNDTQYPGDYWDEILWGEAYNNYNKLKAQHLEMESEGDG